MNELLTSIRDYLRDRIKSPLLGPFSVAWLIWNWKPVLFVLFSNERIEVTVETVVYKYKDLSDQLLAPAFFALSYALVHPFVSWGIEELHAWVRFRKNGRQIDRDEKTIKRSKKKDLAQAERNLILADSEVARTLKAELDRVSAESQKLQGSLSNLEDEYDRKRRDFEANYDKLKEPERLRIDTEIATLEQQLAQQKSKADDALTQLARTQDQISSRAAPQSAQSLASIFGPDAGTVLGLMLMSRPYRLVFNAKMYKSGKPNAHANASKRITFGRSGEIIEGRNDNEHTWRVVGDKFEFIRKSGEVQGRFEFVPGTSGFRHTDDTDTLAIRGQYMYPIDDHDSLSAISEREALIQALIDSNRRLKGVGEDLRSS